MNPIATFADASAASNVMHSYVTPAVATLCTLAGLAATVFLIIGFTRYATSSGNPGRMEEAKKTIRNALLGLVVVFAAAAITALLVHMYSNSVGPVANDLPKLQQIKPDDTNGGLVDVLIKAIVGLLKNIVESIGQPFIKALSFFINSTPLMADNNSVFNLWKTIVAIADGLFVLVVCLLGLQKMSFTSLGFEEISLRQLLPQLGYIFLLMNTSIFIIDAIIGLSNVMIHAVQSAYPSIQLWDILAGLTKQTGDLGLAGLLIMVAFLVVAIMLLVYYVSRIITLYLGAILSPLVLLLWLLPAFKDFAMAALKTYLTQIFVLFVHVVILLLAGSIFVGAQLGDTSGQPNVLMSLIVGLATLTALLKTQGTMKELSYAASAPRAARELSGQFMRGVSSLYRGGMATKNVVTKATSKVSGMNSTSKSTSNSTSKSTSSKASHSTPKSSPKASTGGGQLKTGETKARKVEK